MGIKGILVPQNKTKSNKCAAVTGGGGLKKCASQNKSSNANFHFLNLTLHVWLSG